MRLTTKGTFETPFGTQGTGADELKGPEGIALDGEGNVWVSDFLNDRVDEFSSTGAFKLTIGWGVQNGEKKLETCTSSCQAGIAGSGEGQFSKPAYVAFSGGNLYVTDTQNHRVEEFTPQGSFLREFGSSVLSLPEGIAADKAGNLYVVDHEKGDVVVFSPTGSVVTSFGSRGSGVGQVDDPAGIVISEAGDAYVADGGNDRVEVFREVTPAVHDQKTIYYTSEANSEHAACGEHPAWETLVCGDPSLRAA